mgnify:CR=1 FL=1
MKAIGTDIEDVNKFRNLINDDVKLNKLFTPKELEYCLKSSRPNEHLTARFAGKEATIKAYYSLHNKLLKYKDIEILNGNGGAPILNIYDEKNGHISLSHTKENAIAFVYLEI